jgi:hypothetical protein
MRLSAHFDACADALVLNGGTIDDRCLELIRTLSPSGTIPRDLAAAAH